MSVEVISNCAGNVAAMYCNTSDWAFGPVFEGRYAAEDCNGYINFCNAQDHDPRGLSEDDHHKMMEAYQSIDPDLREQLREA